jgi:hypothetical protein
MGFYEAPDEYDTEIVTDISVSKDSDGKVTDVQTTKKHLHFVHGILIQVDNV